MPGCCRSKPKHLHNAGCLIQCCLFGWKNIERNRCHIAVWVVPAAQSQSTRCMLSQARHECAWLYGDPGPHCCLGNHTAEALTIMHMCAAHGTTWDLNGPAGLCHNNRNTMAATTMSISPVFRYANSTVHAHGHICHCCCSHSLLAQCWHVTV